MNEQDNPGTLTIFRRANLLEDGSYDEPFAGCSAILHVGYRHGLRGDRTSSQAGVRRRGERAPTTFFASVEKGRNGIRRFVYTSSFAAIGESPSKPGYRFSGTGLGFGRP